MTPFGQGVAEAPARVIAAQLDLARAWEKVEGHAGMPGVDNIAVSRFRRSAGPVLRGLEMRMAEDRYHPMPLRLAETEKSNGGRRMLLIPAVLDRVALTAAATWVAARLNPVFDAASFAYRPGLGVRDALRAIAAHRDRGCRWVLDADIRGFFDNIDHTILLSQLGVWLGAESPLYRWCRAWIEASVWDGERTGRIGRGVPQGSPLSPVLANFYLDTFDRALRAEGFTFVRYADDFILLARTPFELDAAQRAASSILTSLRLEWNEEKTRVTTFEKGFRFLGARLTGPDILVPFEKPKKVKCTCWVAPAMPRSLLRAWREGRQTGESWTWKPHSGPAAPATPTCLHSARISSLAGSPQLALLRRTP